MTLERVRTKENIKMATILIKCTKESMNILTVDSEGKQNFLIVNSSEENIKDPNCRKIKVPVCSAKRKIKFLSLKSQEET